jgi:DNA-binding LytR/AlgR family response regulator
MQFAKRGWTSAWGRHAGAALALALLFAFLGPFRTQEAFDRPTRYGFWLGLIPFGYACVLAAFVLVDAMKRRSRLPAASRIGLATLISSVPQTLAVAWAFTLLQPERRVDPANLLALFGAVAAVQLILAIVAFALTRPAPAPSVSSAAPKFLDKLPPHLSGKLIALEAQDHYLKVHTERGTHMMLMRLSDAAAELSEGLQVHRGWWVADDSVTRAETNAGRTILHLSNGLIVPVSRTYLHAVRSNGWGLGS